MTQATTFQIIDDKKNAEAILPMAIENKRSSRHS